MHSSAANASGSITADPAPGIGDHPVGFEDLDLLGVHAGPVGEHVVHLRAERVDGLAEASDLAVGVVGDGVRDHHAGLVEVDVPGGGAFLEVLEGKTLPAFEILQKRAAG